jgi:hypothetical protein
MIDPMLLPPVITATAGFAGAVLGAVLTAWMGVHRFKRERMFDKRVEWYDGVVSILLDTADGAGEMITELEERGSLNPEKREERDHRLSRVDHFATTGLLYSGPTALQRLGELRTELHRNYAEVVFNTPVERIAELRRIRAHLVAGAQMIAADIRRETFPGVFSWMLAVSAYFRFRQIGKTANE